MATQSANTCQVKSFWFSRDRMICELWVGGTPDQPFVYPYKVDVPTVPTGMPVIFVWKLLNPEYRFLDSAVGPTRPVPKVTETSQSFVEGDITDDENGVSGSGTRQRMYRWRFTHPGVANTYTYTLRFQVPNKVDPSAPWPTVSCDPTIASSSN